MLTLRIPGTIILGLAAVSLAACGGTTSAGTGAATSASSSALIHTASMKVAGKTETVLKNARGLTLYYFTPDTATSIACTGGCASTWPPLLSPSGAPTSTPALPGTLSLLNRSVHIRIRRATPIISVYAIRDHKDLTTGLSLRPPLDQVSHREVGAGRRTRIPQRQAQRLSCLRMVSGQVLNNLYRSLTHITNANGGRSRLRADEFTQILQLRIQAVICSIIDQQKKFQPGMVSL